MAHHMSATNNNATNSSWFVFIFSYLDKYQQVNTKWTFVLVDNLTIWWWWVNINGIKYNE